MCICASQTQIHSIIHSHTIISLFSSLLCFSSASSSSLLCCWCYSIVPLFVVVFSYCLLLLFFFSRFCLFVRSRSLSLSLSLRRCVCCVCARLCVFFVSNRCRRAACVIVCICCGRCRLMIPLTRGTYNQTILSIVYLRHIVRCYSISHTHTQIHMLSPTRIVELPVPRSASAQYNYSHTTALKHIRRLHMYWFVDRAKRCVSDNREQCA